jgi:predicted helicase
VLKPTQKPSKLHSSLKKNLLGIGVIDTCGFHFWTAGKLVVDLHLNDSGVSIVILDVREVVENKPVNGKDYRV